MFSQEMNRQELNLKGPHFKFLTYFKTFKIHIESKLHLFSTRFFWTSSYKNRCFVCLPHAFLRKKNRCHHAPRYLERWWLRTEGFYLRQDRIRHIHRNDGGVHHLIKGCEGKIRPRNPPYPKKKLARLGQIPTGGYKL